MSGHFSCSDSDTTQTPAAMTGAIPPDRPRMPSRDVSNNTPALPTRREYPERYTARTQTERRIAVAWLAAEFGWAQPGSDEELLIICGPFLRAGWSARALHRAFLRRPDGREWPGPLPEPRHRDRRDQPRIRSLWALLTSRMREWRDQLGHPIPPPVPTQTPPRGRPRRPPQPGTVPPTPPPRGADVNQALDELRRQLPDRRRRPDRIALLGRTERRRP